MERGHYCQIWRSHTDREMLHLCATLMELPVNMTGRLVYQGNGLPLVLHLTLDTLSQEEECRHHFELKNQVTGFNRNHGSIHFELRWEFYCKRKWFCFRTRDPIQYQTKVLLVQNLTPHNCN